MKKIVDVSGYGHSGKTAISDYLQEFDCFFSFPNHLEFELFRVQGGLLDLYFSIYFSWNLIRSRVRLKEFKKMIHRIGLVQNKLNPTTLWNASGHGYNQYFKDRFIEMSEDYINELIISKQKSFWPYDKLSQTKFALFWDKVYGKLTKKLVLREIYYTDRVLFKQSTSKYIHNLFREVGVREDTHVLLNNAFEPFNPSRCLEMVENSFSIIVDRDPRDIYASMINSQDGFVPSFEEYKNADELKKRMLGFEDINQFITRYRILKNNVDEDTNPNVLRIRYEDFILNHDEVANKIHQHIGLHNLKKNKSAVFNVNDSKKNVGIWKKYRNLPEIIQIEKDLAEYCYQD